MPDLRSWTSSKTASSWRGIGPRTPFTLLLITLLLSLITVIIAVILNITSANEEGNDYGPGTGWVIMMPGPSLALLWTAISIIMCRYARFSPGLALSTFGVFALGLIAEGIFTIMAYDWQTTELGWFPGVFMIILAIDCAIFSGYAVVALRRRGNIKDTASEIESR
ncbi:hypothetical protein TWF694_004451 [Orbilia ellipsospora]|uniref:Uncharacterized protein n=1 Tax=Orbilia ellipsospora TaxID=2528407 RepID=A0AAV9WW96_9PEZI